jgi:para-aminobenzoate synthetase component 1
LSVSLNNGDDPGEIFTKLRRDHPAPFGAFIDRGDSHVISASPERFFKIAGNIISTSPIKGTRPRGRDPKEDERLRNELRQSEKDRAENTMIVDLLRNDLGRVCEYGSVEVKTLCDLEEHPTLFHLVSTVEGRLRNNVTFAEILAALFPCGSITGAPKIRTMQIIDELEPSARGLSMGAIGFFIPDTGFVGMEPGFELSVAIRTMVIRDGVAAFNVGGGVTIESDSQAEYEESLLKAKALLTALGNK